MTLKCESHQRWLAALTDRLRNCPVGQHYSLDPVERELLLTEIDALRKALSQLIVYAESYTDEGPFDEGWKSPEFERVLFDCRRLTGGLTRI